MYPDVMGGEPIQITTAIRTITDYSKAVGDTRGEAELMVFFVERGNDFTVEFGDIDEDFYNALLTMYGKAIRKVVLLPAKAKNRFKERLRKIMISSSGIGGGYHDGICEFYEEAFSDQE